MTDFLFKSFLIKEKHVALVESGNVKDFKSSLAGLKRGWLRKVEYVFLSSHDSRIVSCIFNISDASEEELHDRIRFRAFELLNIPAEDIVWDYQFFSSSNRQHVGLLVCAPKAVIEEYITAADSHKLTPLVLMPEELVNINLFSQSHSFPQERICLLDFIRQGEVTVSLFENNNWHMFRKIKYDDLASAVKGMEQTVQSASIHSRNKEVDRFVIIHKEGMPEGLEPLMEQTFHKKPSHIELNKDCNIVTLNWGPITINLFKDYSISPYVRAGIEMASYGVLLLMVFFSFLLTFKYLNLKFQIEGIKMQYSVSDVRYAEELKERLKSL